MKANFNKPASEILTDLIFQSNGIWIMYGNIEFGTPEALPNPLPWAPNTVVQVTADMVEDDSIEGCTKIIYRRVPLSELIQSVSSPIQIPQYPFKISDLLPQINAMYQIQLQPTDIIDATFNDLSQPIVLNAAPGALCYIGYLTLQVIGPNIVQLVTNTDLDGFTEYQAPSTSTVS